MSDKLRISGATEPLIERLRRATIGRYDIYAELGSGGMATVFLALDLALDRKVAIKVLNPELATSAANVTRFRREAKVAAALDHPNIIGILAVGDDPDLAFFVMKYVEGRALDSAITEDGAQSVAFTRSVVATAARALQYAHQRGVIHRDVKPANLMLDLDGRLIVTDFGIAKRDEATGLTLTGSVIGTPYYMSPEQFNGLPVTGATDQYALGVVAFELLSGRQPYPGNTVGEVMRGHLFDPIPSVRTLRPEVPEALDLAITRMLAKQPEDRFASLEEAARAIESPNLDDESTARTHIIELARSGARQRPVIHVPVSPTPLQRPRASVGDASPTARTAPMVAASSPALEASTAVAPKRRRRWPLVIGLLLLVAGGVGTTYALRPDLFAWTRRAPAPATRVAQATPAPSRSAPLTPPGVPVVRDTAPASAPANTSVSPPPSAPASDAGAAGNATGTRRPNARGRVAQRETQPEQSPPVEPPQPAPQEPAPVEPPRPTTGNVIIGSRLPLAGLFVNDVPHSLTLLQAQTLELPAGRVTLSIRSIRCRSWDSTFTVVAGRTHQIGFRPIRCLEK